jgi:hypothetical protein
MFIGSYQQEVSPAGAGIVCAGAGDCQVVEWPAEYQTVYNLGSYYFRDMGQAQTQNNGGAPGDQHNYRINLTKFNNCLQSFNINATVTQAVVSRPGVNGSITATGPNLYSSGGQVGTITVVNDASTYNAAQLGPLCHVPAAYGCTLFSNPYTNYTNNNNTNWGTVTAQVHEFTHSIIDITTGQQGAEHFGSDVENCVKNGGGIQRIP